MERLGAKFLKEMNLESVSFTEQAVACEMLKAVAVDARNKKYEPLRGDDEIYFTDDILKDRVLVQIIDISSYWSNDIAIVLAESLKAKGIDSPLADSETGYDAVMKFLDSIIEVLDDEAFNIWG